MWRFKFGAVLLAAQILANCASIVDGTSQQISVVTNPPGANCQFHRNGEIVGAVNPTPGGVLIKKTKHHIEIVCLKDGFEEAKFLNKSGIQEATFGNIILGGGIGWAIDSAAGADNKYEGAVNITMVQKTPKSAGAPALPESSSDPAERLRRLDSLHTQGVITPKEYEQKRKEILDAM